jgi:hypothetical protein
MICPRCGMAMRDGVRHGSTEPRTDNNYLNGVRPGRKSGLIFVCSDGCWYELEKVRCAVCPGYLNRLQQNRGGLYCSTPCRDEAARGQPRPRRAGLL